MRAMNHHVWINHLWNIRQILALNLKKEYQKELNTSIEHIKQNYYSIVKNETTIYKKAKYTFIGLFPKSSARIINYRFNTKLKKDIKYHMDITKEKE